MNRPMNRHPERGQPFLRKPGFETRGEGCPRSVVLGFKAQTMTRGDSLLETRRREERTESAESTIICAPNLTFLRVSGF